MSALAADSAETESIDSELPEGGTPARIETASVVARRVAKKDCRAMSENRLWSIPFDVTQAVASCQLLVARKASFLFLATGH